MRVIKQFARLTHSTERIIPRASLCVAVPFEVSAYQPGFGYQRLRQPLDGILDRLWRTGKAFTLVQEADLDALPPGTQTLLFPNGQPIRDKTQCLLAQQAAAGVSILTGNDAIEYLPIASVDEPRFESGSGRIHFFVGKRACLVCSFAEEPAVIYFRGCRLCFTGHALLYEEDGQITRASFLGSFEYGEQLCLVSDVQTGVLISQEQWTLLPMGEGTIRLPMPSRVWSIREDGTRCAMDVHDGILRISLHTAGYSYILSGEPLLRICR